MNVLCNAYRCWWWIQSLQLMGTLMRGLPFTSGCRQNARLPSQPTSCLTPASSQMCLSSQPLAPRCLPDQAMLQCAYCGICRNDCIQHALSHTIGHYKSTRLGTSESCAHPVVMFVCHCLANFWGRPIELRSQFLVVALPVAASMRELNNDASCAERFVDEHCDSLALQFGIALPPLKLLFAFFDSFVCCEM